METNSIIKFETALEKLIKTEGADIHLREGRMIFLRMERKVETLDTVGIITREDCLNLLRYFLNEEKIEEFAAKHNVDFSTVALGRRLRGNAFLERGRIGLVFRLIPNIKTMEELNLPSFLKNIVDKEQGFFLVTGSVGNGKSTTLASIVSLINAQKQKHIITIEDPIEFFYDDEMSFLDQREIGTDVPTFEDALKNSLRQDADVLVVGEMRNRETIQIAITAAQTGHLVLSTLHTNNASQAIERIIDVFPAEAQKEIRTELSISLLGIFSQKLIPAKNGGLIPAYELMLNSHAVSYLIREGRVKDIQMTIENGYTDGHISYNRCLANLYMSDIITKEVALHYSQDPEGLEHLIN